MKHADWQYEQKGTNGAYTNVRVLVHAARSWGKRVWRYHLSLKEGRLVRSDDLAGLCDRFPSAAEELADWCERQALEGAA